MHGVNLDLLKTTPYRADGTSRDPHAHHLAAHKAALRAARRARRQALLARLLRRIASIQRKRAETQADSPIFCPEISHGGPGV